MLREVFSTTITICFLFAILHIPIGADARKLEKISQNGMHYILIVSIIFCYIKQIEPNVNLFFKVISENCDICYGQLMHTHLQGLPTSQKTMNQPKQDSLGVIQTMPAQPLDDGTFTFPILRHRPPQGRRPAIFLMELFVVIIPEFFRVILINGRRHRSQGIRSSMLLLEF